MASAPYRFAFPFLAAAALAAQDWPSYHGPNGDRTAAGEASGIAVVWKTETPLGFSSLAVAGERAYTLINRDDTETCVALSVKDGKELWAAPLGAAAKYDGGGDSGTADNQGGDGPRSTPTVAGDRVYVFDSRLVLHCLGDVDGELLWKRDLVAEHGGKNITWQNAASPLVEGDAVIVAGGGAGQALLAFHAANGKVLWKTGEEKITHATPIAAEIGGVRQVIFYLQSGLVAVAPASGEELWRIDYPFSISSAASPVVEGDIVYVSAGYGVGAGAYRILHDEGKFRSELVWRQRNKLMNHWSTPVVKDGHLYGMFSFKKYGKGPLACVELATGDTKWSTDGFGPGNCILVGDRVVALSDAGELVLVEAKPDAYTEVARADVLDGKCWSSPTFAGGRLFVRSTVEGACIDVTGKATNSGANRR
jgi:outer membrane protein assembly factor BamB